MPNQKQNFEVILTQLEEIVTKLENADIPLEEALAAYEEGMLLSKQCNKMLEDAQNRITKLMPDGQEIIHEENA